jgi:hypothetical protein
VLVVVGLLLDGLLAPQAASTIPAVATKKATRLGPFAAADAGTRDVVGRSIVIADRS